MTVKNLVLSLIPPFLRRYTARIEASPLGYRLAKGAFWSLAGAVISRGLALIASILVARILGKEGFGELGIIQSTVGMFGVFAGFGMGMTATKHVAEFRQSNPKKAGHIIALSSLVAVIAGGLISVVLFMFAPWLATKTLAAPNLTNVIKISSTLLFLSAINGAQTGALAGCEAFKSIAKVNLFGGILSFPFIVGGTFINGLNGAVWGLVLSMGVNCLANHVVLGQEAKRFNIPLTYSGSFAEWPVLWKFSVPAVLSGAMVGPATWVCNAILVNQPNGYAEMGIFNAANQWRMAILFLPGILATIVLPMLSELHGENDRKNYDKVLWYNFILNTGVSVLIAAVISLASTVIMSSYGIGFSTGGSVLVLLSFSAVLAAGVSVIGQVLTSKGYMWWGFCLNLFWAIVLTSSTWVLRNKGAMGLATATLLAYGVHFITVGTFVYFKLAGFFSLYRTKNDLAG